VGRVRTSDTYAQFDDDVERVLTHVFVRVPQTVEQVLDGRLVDQLVELVELQRS
jgi:hypothetical protein